jgi:apolipoprotein N-acyltransferase
MSVSSLRVPLYFFFSWVIVAFGQPARSPELGLIAAVCGYALFWKGMVEFSSRKKRFLAAFLWFAAVQGIHLSWMTSIKYVGPMLLLLYFFLWVFWGAQFAFVSLWIPKEGKVPPLLLLFIPALWTMLEWSRLHIVCGFPWNPTGHPLAGNLYSLQLVSVTGVYGHSFWVTLVNLITFNLFIDLKHKKVQGKSLLLWGAMIAFPYLFGWAHLVFHERQMAEKKIPSLTVLSVQTSIFPDQKSPYNGSKRVLSPYEQWERILYALREYQGKPLDLILLPEAAVPYGTDEPIYKSSTVQHAFQTVFKEKIEIFPTLSPPIATLMQDGNKDIFYAVGNRYWAQSIANYFGADLIIGLEDYDQRHLPDACSYQAAFIFHPFQIAKHRYEKRMLVPLGEYIPFEWCKGLAASFGIYDSFSPGKGAKVFQSKFPLGISICYEEGYGNLMRENRLQGAKLLVNVTNDSWYPNSKLARQHFYHAIPRAVENGFPLLRCCNTGVSAYVDSLGRTIAELGSDDEILSSSPQVLISTIPIYQYETLYTFWGDKLIVVICMLIILISLFLKRTFSI